MNKAELTRMGVTDEAIQNKILSKFNGELKEYRKKAAELLPYQEALHSVHLGYHEGSDLPKPETPAVAIKQLVEAMRITFDTEAAQIMAIYQMGVTLLSQWPIVNTLSVDAQKQLRESTKEFLSKHTIPDVKHLHKEHVHDENCKH